jgi:Rieske Fe-S protein
LEGQAQFHPLRHVQALARAAAESGCKIFEKSAVLGMDYNRRSASTALGRVQADAIVLATHSPKGFHPVQAEMVVHQEYLLALRVEKGSLAPGVFWASGGDALSLRALQSEGGSDFLVCAGEEHKVGDHDTAWAEAKLASTVQKYFGRTDAAFRWVAQNYRSADGLPFVGEDLTGCYIATGFATDGLVWGTVAARVLAEELLGRKHPLDHLLDARRFSPIKGARILFEENLTVTKALVKDYLLPERTTSLSALAPGEGAVVRLGHEDVAAYHHPDGAYSLVSPVCPHMKCKVRWSSASTSWDCPCHGSRFRPDGSVIEGPALQALAPRGHLLDQALADGQVAQDTAIRAARERRQTARSGVSS